MHRISLHGKKIRIDSNACELQKTHKTLCVVQLWPVKQAKEFIFTLILIVFVADR